MHGLLPVNQRGHLHFEDEMRCPREKPREKPRKKCLHLNNTLSNIIGYKSRIFNDLQAVKSGEIAEIILQITVE